MKPDFFRVSSKNFRRLKKFRLKNFLLKKNRLKNFLLKNAYLFFSRSRISPSSSS